IAIDQLAVRARAEPLPPQLFERDVKHMKEPRVIDDARVVDVREPDRRRIRERRHQRFASRCNFTPHAAGTPGHGGASFSSSIATAACGYISWILPAIAPASASSRRNVDFVPSPTTISLTFQ